MSGENVDRLRELYARMGRGDFGGADALLAPDIVYEPVADGRATYHGIEAFGTHFREFLAQWDDFRIEILELEDLGETVLVTERQHGTGRASGIEAEMTFYATWTFRDGQVTRARWDTNRERALEAVGRA